MIICGGKGERTWLGGQFAPAKWNVYSEQGPRMNNNLEGWHSKVKTIVGKNHLNIFEIVKLLKKEQASKEVEIRQLMAGGTRRQAPRQRNEDITLYTTLTTTPSWTI